MHISNDAIDEIINNPAESLDVELKTWIDPAVREGEAKIAKACLAMRNNNGGIMLIGFNDDTHNPDPVPDGYDPGEKYTTDKVQGIVSKYSSDPFAIELIMRSRDGQQHPIIRIPSGVQKPVVAKKDLRDVMTRFLIKKNQIYVRSVVNGRVSSSEIQIPDWDSLMRACQDNREADTARFIRRHLGLSNDAIKGIISQFYGAVSESREKQEEEISRFIESSLTSMNKMANDKSSEIPDIGFYDVYFRIKGLIPEGPKGKDFIEKIQRNVPGLTGRPLWSSSLKSSQEYSKEGWMNYTCNQNTTGGISRFDFWRIDPPGKFFQRRAIYDDLQMSVIVNTTPLTTLEYIWAIYYIADSIYTALRIARALDVAEEGASLDFCIGWHRLKGRTLSSWAHTTRYMDGNIAKEDDLKTFISIPLQTSESSIFQYVSKLANELFLIFEGAEFDIEFIEQIVREFLGRK